MLVIVIKTEAGFMDKEAHLGTQLGLSDALIDVTFCVQADGDELQAIYSQFEGLPRGGNRVMKWYGDHAKFIAGNLKL